MRTRSLWKISTAVLVAVAACGCSLSAGSQSESGPTYRQAMDAMYPDVLGAVKATMPKIEVDEYSGGISDCGGPDFLDGKDASKRRSSAIVRLPGDTSDKRTSDDLVNSVVERLADKGWKEEKRQDTSPAGASDRALKYMKKPKTAGVAIISSSSTRLTSGKTIRDVTADMVTDCLRNPDWNKG